MEIAMASTAQRTCERALRLRLRRFTGVFFGNAGAAATGIVGEP